MSRAPSTFKSSDVTRALKAVQAAGLPVVRTEIGADGKITLVHEASVSTEQSSDFDRWKASRHAR
ncbi:MAG: hypothetical protein WC068_08270 [Caulobacter sp.]|jgi:hypothetical protein